MCVFIFESKYMYIYPHRYSTLLATMESLSLLLRMGQLSSLISLVSRLTISIEQRMEQLNKPIQILLAANLSKHELDLNDEDLPSFHSALSSYEHLPMIP